MSADSVVPASKRFYVPKGRLALDLQSLIDERGAPG